LCFRLRLSFPTPTFLCLIVIVVISLRGSFLSSTAVSLIATGFLDYYFIPPLFSFSVSEPADIVTLLAFLTTSTTITQLVSRVRQLMEDKLKMSEAYLSEAQQLSHTGSFGWKTATDKITWSAETFRIFGCDPATTPTVEVILKRVHPEDVPVVKQTIERAAVERHDWQLEHRLLLPDGQVKYVSVVARVSSDQPGPCEFVGAIMDVTERRLAEESLRQAHNGRRIDCLHCP
jgi:PAS domain S-box-containing protein